MNPTEQLQALQNPANERSGYLTPVGSDALPEHLPEDPPLKSDLCLGD